MCTRLQAQLSPSPYPWLPHLLSLMLAVHQKADVHASWPGCSSQATWRNQQLGNTGTSELIAQGRRMGEESMDMQRSTRARADSMPHPKSRLRLV